MDIINRLMEIQQSGRWMRYGLAAAVFVSAFLLFLVQPLMGRFLLPWFGGMPEVWTACMLFFQIALLAGYAYAHWLGRFSMRRQAVIHLIFAAAACLTAQVAPKDNWKPSPEGWPALQIILICAASVGLAYVFLSASSPLLQRWFAAMFPCADAYRLYALSNAGSFLALAAFPFVFEPLMRRQSIAAFWQGGFWFFAAIMAALCARVFCVQLPADQKSDAPCPKHTPIVFADVILWVALPMCGSALLLAATNKLTMDIAVVPFLWTLPLGLYLASFILCFEHPRVYQPTVWFAALVASLLGHVWAGRQAEQTPVWVVAAVYCAMVFSGCMICHGQTYLRRPQAGRLTAFYLALACGGALGGVFAAVISPLIFQQYHELHLAALGATLISILCRPDVSDSFRRRRKYWAVVLCVVGLAGIVWQDKRAQANETIVARERNFFGVLTIVDQKGRHSADDKRLMQHGTTYHGLQFLHADKRRLPTGYYDPDSGIGLLLKNWPQDQPFKVGVVGLGAGTLAAYGRPGDMMVFYEINPAVLRLAKAYFTFLDDSAASVSVLLGDARLTMESQPPQQYDVLALDAFSSDAVPTHLLTVEAFEIFLRHLKPDGVLAVHLSTRYLDLTAVALRLAAQLGLQAAWIESYGSDRLGALASDWVLLSRSRAALDIPAIQSRQSQWTRPIETIPLWTDDYAALLPILKKQR